MQLLFDSAAGVKGGDQKMILTHKITLSLNSREGIQSIDAVQGDTVRAVELTLLENGLSWAVPEDVEAVIRYRRIYGGSGGIYDSLPDGGVAWSVSENKVTVLLAPAVLAVPGPVEVQVTLTQAEAELTCFSFLIHVQGNLGEPEETESYVNLSRHIQETVEGMNLARKDQGILYIVGDSDSSFGNWKGTCPEIEGYFDGLTIAYKTVASGGSPMTTLDINGLGAVDVKRNGSSDVNYLYPAGAVVMMTYTTTDGTGTWQVTDSNTNSDTLNTTGTSNKVDTKMYLVGATARTEAGTKTYTNVNCYIGADNRLYSSGEAVLTASTLPKDTPDYVRQEAQRVAALAQSRQNGNTLTLLLGSDIHARLGLSGSATSAQMEESTRHAAQAMQIIRSQIHVDACGLLGDQLWDQGETVEQAMEMNRLINEWFTPAFVGLTQFRCKGDHDMLGNSASGGAELTQAQVFAALGSHCSGVIFDKGNRVLGYCHKDFTDLKVRVACLNTSETLTSQGIGEVQLQWLQKVLSVDTGWQVILLSHIPLDWWGTESTVYQTLAQYEDKILCNIHGHTHNYVTGLLGDTGIPRIAVPNIGFYYPNIYGEVEGYGEPSGSGYGKVAGSEADTAFCVITVDTVRKMLYADHYGAGCDRIVDLTDGTTT